MSNVLRAAALLAIAVLVEGCRDQGPVPLPAGKTECAQCRMVLADPRFTAQHRSPKGRVSFFDSVECAWAWAQRPQGQGGRYYLRSFLEPPRWLTAEEAWIVEWAGIRSPMGRGWAAFASREEAMRWLAEAGAEESAYRLRRWEELPRGSVAGE